MAYSISKLTDYSAAAVESAANECVRACQKEASAVRNDAELKAFRDRWIGRKSGILKQINDLWLKAAPKEAKRNVGHVVMRSRRRWKTFFRLLSRIGSNFQQELRWRASALIFPCLACGAPSARSIP